MQSRPIAETDIPRAAALSAMAGWNQTTADWEFFRRFGSVRVLDDGSPDSLVATAATIRYVGIAWIGMILVRPDMRGRGIATQLMEWAISSLADVEAIGLDATPAGLPLYKKLGFREAWGFRRWRLPEFVSPEFSSSVRRLVPSDWHRVRELDSRTFGAYRRDLLRQLGSRAPQSASVAADGDMIRGFALAREGLRASQIGPVVAPDIETAQSLIAAARAGLPHGPSFIDVRWAPAALVPWLKGLGGKVERPFTRMFLRAWPPGDASDVIAVTGPEFG